MDNEYAGINIYRAIDNANEAVSWTADMPEDMSATNEALSALKGQYYSYRGGFPDTVVEGHARAVAELVYSLEENEYESDVAFGDTSAKEAFHEAMEEATHFAETAASEVE